MYGAHFGTGPMQGSTSGGVHFGGGGGAAFGGGGAAGVGGVHLGGGSGGIAHGGAGATYGGHFVGGVMGTGAASAGGGVAFRPPEAGHACGCSGEEAGGCGVGCAEACSVATGPAAMTFVGPGAGEYTTEVSYKFVGAGGEYSMVTAKRNYFCLITSVMSLIVIIVLALVFTNGPTPTTTSPPSTTQRWTPPATTRLPPSGPVWTTPRPPVIGTCICWGDPHFVGFDGGRQSFYGEGEFWIVKSPKIKIQGRYMGTKYTHGLAATNKIVVGGDFLQGHTIGVGPMESGELFVDGLPVLTTFPSTYTFGNGLGRLVYNAEGELPDKAAAVFQRHILHMELPMGVRITVFRWANYMDLRIHMPQQAEQDGSCGNFNGNAADDTTDQIFARIGARVPYNELLFHRRQTVEVSPEMQRMIAADCPQHKLEQAKSECTTEMSAPSLSDMDSCVFDFCFGMNEHALRTATKYT